MKKLWLIPAVIAGVAAARTIAAGKKTSTWKPEKTNPALSEKLSKMVQAETVSEPGIYDKAKFDRFHEVLEELFPRTFSTLEVNNIDGNLLLYWKGKSHDRPIVIMSHQDVVPAEGEWKHPPFSGDIAEGKVWGRGAADTKSSLMAFYEAVEQLLEAGFEPEQDIYLSSSCTEEWSGDGCPKLVAELEKRGVRPFLVIDEGGAIITDPIGGIKGNFAMVGLFEKGQADVVFTAHSTGGHASAPGKNTPVDRLAAFVCDVKKSPEFKVEFEPEVKHMFEHLAPYAPLGMRVLFSNLWLFGPLMKKVMPMLSPQAEAMLKTTVAFTMMEGSTAYNVIPEKATVAANIRYIPHQPEKATLELLKKLADKHGLDMEVVMTSDHTTPAKIDGDAYRLVCDTINKTFPGLPVSPYVVTGGTDAKCYQKICDSCLRFAPVVYGPEQMKGMHGINENIEESALPAAVEFYKNLIRGAN